MPDLHYTHPRLAALYDIECGWGTDRDFYLSLAGDMPKRVLDLGCGTGLLCDAYAARGHQVTGVDPAEAMLAVARGKPNGSKVEWICAKAQNFHSDKRFDLIVMTGHAFQAINQDDAIVRTLTVMRKHLAEDGLAVFETRNPAKDWPGRWTREFQLHTDGGPVRVTRSIVSVPPGRIVFDTAYAFADKTMVSRSDLRFLSDREVRTRAAAAGLEIVSLAGDWRGGAYDPASSDEMIYAFRRL